MKNVPSQLAKLGINIEDSANWPERDLNTFFKAVMIPVDILRGRGGFIEHLKGLTVEKTETGTSLGLAYRDRIKFTTKSSLSTWTVLHELAHVWDARNGWRLSRDLEKFTGGFTLKLLSTIKRLLSINWDAGKPAAQNRPGTYGRRPGCNAAGYFYGDKPSGSNWSFNRREDFAESVVMYLGWGHQNELSATAHGRIARYLLANGKKDPIYGIADDWADYARFFYPQDGDYRTTKRWGFVDRLTNNKKASPS